jgi:biotin operon repressor
MRRWHGRIENVCDHGGMTREQRRQAMERMLAEDPSVSQQSIAAALGVSQNTISKDLRALEEREGLNLRSSSGRGRPRGSVTKLHVGIAGVVTAGDQLVAKLRDELDAKGLEPDSREEGLLEQIASVGDEIAELRERITLEGQTFKPASPGGPPRLHPAIAEVRQLRSLLGRLLSQISLEESVKSPVMVKAANTRWRAHQMARARQAEGGQGG